MEKIITTKRRLGNEKPGNYHYEKEFTSTFRVKILPYPGFKVKETRLNCLPIKKPTPLIAELVKALKPSF